MSREKDALKAKIKANLKYDYDYRDEYDEFPAYIGHKVMEIRGCCKEDDLYRINADGEYLFYMDQPVEIGSYHIIAFDEAENWATIDDDLYLVFDNEIDLRDKKGGE